ncbi:MAG TPA: glycoside hydrolase family 97 protein [Bryobacteraceae bacterium]|jgi:alpha-glucosidase
MKSLPLLFLATSLCALGQIDEQTISSPNGQIEFHLFGYPQQDSSESARLAYQVYFHGRMLMDTSYLGLNIRDQPVLGVNLGFMTSHRETVDETYTVPAGKTKSIRNHYNALFAEYMQNGTLGRKLTMEIRVYDDGVAFRYDIPFSNPLQELLIENDSTQFRFVKDGNAFPLFVENLHTNYEDQYQRMTLSGIHNDSNMALPLLVEQPGLGWVAITEANLDNFAGMYLHHLEGRALEAVLSPKPEDEMLAMQGVTPARSPWRVLLIGSDPGRLIESNLVSNLNPPSEIKDTSWIKPGKSASAQTAMGTGAIQQRVDFAAASKLQYMLIDEGWAAPNEGTLPADITKTISAVDMPEILRYAKSKGVSVWLWTRWESVQLQMEPAFAQFEKWGVAGVQIDGMNRDDQWMVDFYHRAAKAAAAHRLMIDFHGAYKPDGMSRTWPNVITQEAVLGAKYLRSSALPNPDHDVMLAFTRMLAGPMDYGPGGFDNVTLAEFEPRETRPMTLGTRAHQLALYVVFDSPLMMVSDAPEAYQGQKDFDFVKEVPASWDETRVVSGKVGEFVTVARRSGRDWYLGSITNADSRAVDVPLEFLGSGNWTAEMYSDASDADANPKHTSIDRKRVTAGETLKIALASGGGVAIRFTPAP